MKDFLDGFLEGLFFIVALIAQLLFAFLLAFGIFFLACFMAGCDDAGLFAIPPDAGPARAEEGTRWREELPPPPPEACTIALVWPDDLGPPEGECLPGWVDSCSGDGRAPVLPTPTDQDCDGINDDECAPWAMLLLIDGSGSMDPYRAGVGNALCALDGRADASRALVAFGDRHPDHATLLSPWGGRLCGRWGRTSGPEWAGEATELAIEFAGWPEGSPRMLIIVTDEAPQSSYTEGDGTERVLAACLEGGFEVGVLTRTIHTSRWEQVVSACGGFVTQLTADPLFALSGAERPCVQGS